MINIITRFINRGRYVLLDPTDNSVTLSKRLWSTIEKDHNIPDDVYTCQLTDGRYAFVVNPYENALADRAKERDAPVSKIQFNEKTKTIGFAPDIPTVATMSYTYDLPHAVCKMSVTRQVMPTGVILYIIEPCRKK